MTGPRPYSDRHRLAEQIADAREALEERGEIPSAGWPARCGELEALLKMLADAAGAVLGEGPGT